LSEGRLQVGEDPSRRVWFVDLVLGAWRPREAASQLALALGIELKAIPAYQPERTILAGDRRMIDVEAAGEPVVTRAYDDAVRIAPALWAGATVAVLAPRYGLPLRIENEWFLFLLRRLGVAMTIVGEEPVLSVGKTIFERRRVAVPELPARPWLPAGPLRLLRFFPGLLPQSIAAAEKINTVDAELIPVGTDHFLIPITYRDADPARNARELDALADAERLDQGLRALCQSYCTGYFADAAGLAELARRHLQAGSIDLADSLAARARLVARRPEEAALADLRRQEIRLAGRHFGEMAAAAPPSLQASAPLQQELARMRVAGTVMAGEVADAEPALEPLVARLKAEEPVAPDDLLLLSALAEARAGKRDVGGGYFLAEAVEAALARDPDADQRLVFRNALGLAGIHRLRANRDDRRAALERAYATSQGGRTLHEIVELNALAAAAEADPRSEAAGQAWLRAALAWLALEPPEGLSRRALEIVLGRDDAQRSQLDLDISETLADALEAAWPDLPVSQRQRFPVVRGVAIGGPRPERVLAGPGAGILWSPSAEISAVYARPRQRLIRLVLAALASIAPAIGEVVTGTILIDANLGVDVPRSRDEALTVALRYGAGELVFGTETLFLDEGLRPRLAADLRVALSPLVQRVVEDGNRRVIRFRRHLPDRTLSPEEARIVSEFKEGASLTLAAMAVVRGESHAGTEAVLRPLEAERIVRLDAVAR
jgi:hypothetical protein